MPGQGDREYLLDRVTVEWHLSQTASNLEVAQIHRQLAERYEQRVVELDLPGAVPRIDSGAFEAGAMNTGAAAGERREANPA